MKSPVTFWIMLILASGFAGALLLWTGQMIWHHASELDQDTRRFGVKSQIKRRKADAMHEVLDEMVAGNLARVHSAAKRIERYGETIDGFLASDAYDKYGDDFHQAVDDLIATTARKDLEGAKQATLRLEQSCIDCHALLNVQGADPR